MNILPLVIIILMILGLGASTLTQGCIGTKLEKKSLLGYLNAQRKIWNKKEQAIYRRQQEKPKIVEAVAATSATTPPDAGSIQASKEETHEEEEEESLKKKYFREKKCAHDSGKFNLYPLLHDPDSAHSKHLYEPAAKLIRILYEHAPFWRKNQDLEYKILDALMKIEDRSFRDAITEDSEFASIFYKMLKGSNTYIPETEKGIPPFLDFFRDEESANKQCKIDFRHAPRSVLKVFLGDTLVEKIETLEKNENKPLTKGAFDPLLDPYPQKKSELQQLDLFKFSDLKDDTISDIGIDAATGISVKGVSNHKIENP